MDIEPPRLYKREWKRNKPYLPKSTSLPLLKLAPEDRAIFICKRCGFSNLLVPMCLWCCWSSAEARHDFEARASKSLRRVARSAPRLFNGKPVLSTNSHRDGDIGAGRHRCSKYHTLRKAPKPHASNIAAVTSTHTKGYHPRQVFHEPPWFSFTGRGNQGKEEAISERRKTLSHQTQGQLTGFGANDCGTGSCHFPPDPSRTGYHHKTKGATSRSSRLATLDCPHCLSASCPPQSRPPLFKKPPLSSNYFSVPSLLGSIFHPVIRARGVISTPPKIYSNHFGLEAFDSTTTRVISMMRDLDAPLTDTRYDTNGALIPEWASSTTTTHYSVLRHTNPPTAQLDYTNCNYRETVPMDVDVATAIQSNQAPTSQMNQAEAPAAAMQSESCSDIEMTTETTITKTSKKRPPIPSILLHQDSTHNDTPIGSETLASPSIPTMTEMTVSAMKTDHPPSPARTLKRKKRLSLIGLSATKNSDLAPPARSPPLSPPPLDSPPQSPSTTLPAIVTPPESPSHTCSTPGKFPPSIVISAPSSITSMVIEPSRPIPSAATTPTQTLPRIGTAKRPYYSTIRANNRTPSSVSPSSTPPSSPSSSTFPGPVSGGFPSPLRSGTPGIPDQSCHLDARGVQRPSILVDRTVAEGDGASGSPKTHRPVSTSAIASVPPSSPVMATRSPTPISVPSVQVHMRPSSPVRSILSVLDPAHGDEEDDDDEADYNQFGISSTRLGGVLRKRRNSEKKTKGDGGNGYHFPLSLPLSLGRKRGRTLGSTSPKSQKDKSFTPTMLTLSSSRSYSGFGSFGMGRGCSMSGEVEMRMALAERSINANGGSTNGLEPAFKFRESPRPSCDGEGLERRTSDGKRPLRMRSALGLSSASLTASPPSSPSKPKIGSRLKEMSVSLFGKLQGGDANRL